MEGIPEEVRHSASELVLCCVSSLDRSVALPALMASSYCTLQRARSHLVERDAGKPTFPFLFFPPTSIFQRIILKCCQNFCMNPHVSKMHSIFRGVSVGQEMPVFSRKEAENGSRERNA